MSSVINLLCHAGVIFHFCFTIIFLWNFALAQRNNGNCYTPNNRPGLCIQIRKCGPLLSLLKKGPPNPTVVAFLQRSTCGFVGKNPLVCCPFEEELETTNPPSVDLTFSLPLYSTPKDVSRHPKVQLLLPRSCGFFTEEKITGGNASGLFEFPWMAQLGYNTENGFQFGCGGSLINARYVLTAAHCIRTSRNLQLVQVRLGEYDVNSEIDCKVDTGCAPPVQDFGIEQVLVHPNYLRQEFRDDIGLIRLNRNAIFTDSVSPICLPIGKALQDQTLEGEELTVAGWGATENGMFSSTLQKVKIPVMSLELCAELIGKMVRLNEKQICAGGVDKRDSCSGDSGGPLQKVDRTIYGDFNYIQFGIVSFGPIFCGSKIPGVYTRVGYYMEWLLDNMN